MNKLFKFVFALTLGVTCLTGCDSTTDYSDDSLGSVFHFYAKKGSTEIEIGEYPVKDIIKLNKDEFVSKHLDNSLENRYPYYSFNNIVYTTGTEFAFDFETTNKYLNETKPDYTFGFLWASSGWNVYLNYTPITYTIQYVGYEDSFTDKTSYSFENQFALPSISEEHRNLIGWKIQGTDTVITQTPSTDLSNLVLEPVFENKTYTISYSSAVVTTNPNPTSYTYYDETIVLVPLADDPNGHYVFDGFYINDEKVTTIDPHLGQNLLVECRFIFTEYTAKYYVDGEIAITQTFTILTLKDYVEPNVPVKDHYDGKWSGKVEEAKNYDFTAIYTPKMDEYKITYKGVKGADNPNPTAYSFFDEIIELKALESNEKINFKGWKIDDKYVTSFNPQDYLRDIVIVADIEVIEYTIKYYVEDELYKTDKVTFETLPTYQMPDIPSKEHYQAKWDDKVDSLKDYTINATYELDKFTIKVVTNIEGFDVDDIVVEYGADYASVIDQIKYDDKFIIDVYSDEALTTPVIWTTKIDKDVTIYLKWETLVRISSADDWSKIVDNPSSNFILDADISFKGGEIPTVSNFKGVLDGQGHKITRFAVSKTNCASNFGLFITNEGTIKNLVVEDGSFVAKNADGSSSASIGLLCGTNKGTIENVDFKTINANITTTYWTSFSDFQDHTGYLYSGLLCGNNQGTIKNCYIDNASKATFKTRLGYSRTSGRPANGFVYYGYTYHGSISGVNTGTIENITSDGQIVLDSITLDENAPGTYDVSMKGGCSYNPRAGGLVGINQGKGVVNKSISNASISLKYGTPATRYDNPYSTFNVVGGVVGINEAEVNSCQTTSTALISVSASGTTEIGGIVGRNEADSKLKACYSECRFSVSSSSGIIYVGGLVGRNNGAISYSYACLTDFNLSIGSKRGLAAGGLVGDISNTGTIMFSFAYVNFNANITNIDCYALGYASSSPIFNKIMVYAPTQSTTINGNDEIDSAESMDDLYAAAKAYYFDEIGFTIYDDKLPIIKGIGKIVEEDNSEPQNNND